VKQVVLPQPADPVFVDPPNQDQYFAAEDIASNSSVGRPYFYQVVILPCFFRIIVLLTASKLLNPPLLFRDILRLLFQQVRFKGIQICILSLSVHLRCINEFFYSISYPCCWWHVLRIRCNWQLESLPSKTTINMSILNIKQMNTCNKLTCHLFLLFSFILKLPRHTQNLL
jgi:hypothetical protein